MPHYLDGTEARVGDIVRGRGYNIKDRSGHDKLVTAVVLRIDPDADTCNVTVLVPDGCMGSFVTPDHKHGALVSGQIEYGQTDHFERIHT